MLEENGTIQINSSLESYLEDIQYFGILFLTLTILHDSKSESSKII